MKKSFLNIGNKAFLNTDKIICIVAADSDKMRRILAHDNLKRTNPKVIDTTSYGFRHSISVANDSVHNSTCKFCQ